MQRRPRDKDTTDNRARDQQAQTKEPAAPQLDENIAINRTACPEIGICLPLHIRNRSRKDDELRKGFSTRHPAEISTEISKPSSRTRAFHFPTLAENKVAFALTCKTTTTCRRKYEPKPYHIRVHHNRRNQRLLATTLSVFYSLCHQGRQVGSINS
jgi:hypothetical protein